ncbi:MAG: hypothetical protein H6Q15_2180 [Bacteroidetes bacterium]|nr:hypothetical protein [Bacteroidota bacterium]
MINDKYLITYLSFTFLLYLLKKGAGKNLPLEQNIYCYLEFNPY